MKEKFIWISLHKFFLLVVFAMLGWRIFICLNVYNAFNFFFAL